MRTLFLLIVGSALGCSGLLGLDDDEGDDTTTALPEEDGGDQGVSSGLPPSGSSGGSSGSSSSGNRPPSSSSGGASSGGSSSGGSSSGELPPSVIALSAGTQMSCAVTSRGHLLCWSGSETSPKYFLESEGGPPLAHVTAVDLGNAAHCALTHTPNRIVCWGSNGYGMLGDGTNSTGSRGFPVTVVDSDGDAIDDWADALGADALSVSNETACGVREGGRVACWGRSIARYASPVAASANEDLVDIVQVAAGTSFACALRDDRRVLCWGSNIDGALGNGTTSTPSYPTVVQKSGGGALTGVSRITAGEGHVCALVDGAAYCWGRNRERQLGAGLTSNGATTAQPVLGIDEPLRQIAAGARHTCAVTNSGLAYCWGHNGNGSVNGAAGRLGNGSIVSPQPTPSLVLTAAATPLAGTASIVGGYYHTLALGVDRSAWGFGDRAILGPDSLWAQRMPLDELPALPAAP